LTSELESILVKAIVEALEKAVTILPPDVLNALEKAYAEEESEIARAQLKAILDNVKIARESKTAICQDTGLITYYVKVGHKFPLIDKLEDLIIEATR